MSRCNLRDGEFSLFVIEHPGKDVADAGVLGGDLVVRACVYGDQRGSVAMEVVGWVRLYVVGFDKGDAGSTVRVVLDAGDDPAGVARDRAVHVVHDGGGFNEAQEAFMATTSVVAGDTSAVVASTCACFAVGEVFRDDEVTALAIPGEAHAVSDARRGWFVQFERHDGC